MTIRTPLHRLPVFAVGLAIAASLFITTPALAQTVAAAWRSAQAREQTARKTGTTLPKTLRAIATSYENIVRKYPTSGYADNALWQAAGLLELAYQRGGARIDRDNAMRMLQWLKREYPASAYAKQVGARVAALTPRPAGAEPASARAETPAARPSATSMAPAPAAVSPVAAAAVPTPASSAAIAPKPPQPPPIPPAPSTPRTTAPAGTAAPTAGATAVPGATAVRSTPLPAVTVPEVFKDFPIALKEVTSAPLPRGERVILELTQELAPAVERTTTPTQDQLTITLKGTGVAPGAVDSAARVRGTILRGLRVNARPDGIQLRVDLSGKPRYSTFPLYDPYRIVIDFESEEAGSGPVSSAATPSAVNARATATPAVAPRSPAPSPAAAAATTAPAFDDASTRPLPPSSTKSGGYSLARQLGLGVSRVVIDPGHGGHDPGAQANGISEAELVLDIAKRVETLLHDQPGFDVVLTRRTNDYIPLEERTAIANREKADLFLSIHANSSPQSDTRGVETYVLNFASNPQAESVAARENASSTQAMGGLPQLVKAITLNNKLTESRELASLVQTSMMRRLVVQNKGLRDLGVKQAPFVVLIGAQMPSVLAEISFITNRSDASLLRQNAYRQRIAQALCDAVLKYSASLKKVATVAANAEER